MLIAKPVRPEWRDRIPAIVHVDGTARVQTVRESTNPLLYRLLKEFEALTSNTVLYSFSCAAPAINSSTTAIGWNTARVLILAPAAQAAPDHYQDAGKTNHRAEHAAEKSGEGVSGRADPHRLERRTDQPVEGIEHQEHRNYQPHAGRIGPAQHRYPDHDTGHAADHKRPYPSPIEGVSKLPGAVALKSGSCRLRSALPPQGARGYAARLTQRSARRQSRWRLRTARR